MKIGVITIGQTPRLDITGDLVRLLPEGTQIVERGALDGLSSDEIDRYAPGPGDYPLVTLLQDGRTVDVGKERLLPLIATHIRDLESSVGAILLLCSGPFPDLPSRVPVLYPSRLLDHFVRGIGPSRATVLVPHPGQVQPSVAHWGSFIARLEVVVRSPYPFDPEGVQGDFVIMDCLGYSLEMKRAVRHACGGQAVLVRSVAAAALRELIE